MRVPVRHSRESSQGLQAAVPPALPTGIRHLGSPTRMHCRLPPRPMASNAADHAVGKKAPFCSSQSYRCADLCKQSGETAFPSWG